jgi:hypothetical protein
MVESSWSCPSIASGWHSWFATRLLRWRTGDFNRGRGELPLRRRLCSGKHTPGAEATSFGCHFSKGVSRQVDGPAWWEGSRSLVDTYPAPGSVGIAVCFHIPQRTIVAKPIDHSGFRRSDAGTQQKRLGSRLHPALLVGRGLVPERRVDFLIENAFRVEIAWIFTATRGTDGSSLPP